MRSYVHRLQGLFEKATVPGTDERGIYFPQSAKNQFKLSQKKTSLIIEFLKPYYCLPLAGVQTHNLLFLRQRRGPLCNAYRQSLLKNVFSLGKMIYIM
jgi:hypothetical protein